MSILWAIAMLSGGVALFIGVPLLIIGWIYYPKFMKEFARTLYMGFGWMILIAIVTYLGHLISGIIDGEIILSKPMTALVIISGTFVFVMASLPILGGVHALVNRPNLLQPPNWDGISKFEKSTFGFFTFLEPGRVKVIERGKRFVRAIMDYDGHMFKGESNSNTLTPDHADYWEVVQSGSEPDSHPLPFPGFKGGPFWILRSAPSIAWWMYKMYVYTITGAVFTGIHPFQSVRTYPIERFKIHRDTKGEITLEKINDYSDHYRVAQFQFPVFVPSADTKGKIKVGVRLNPIAKGINPNKIAYQTDDDWTSRFAAAVANAVTNFTRTRPLKEVMSGTPKTVGDLAKAVMDITSILDFGMKIVHVEIFDISLADTKLEEKIADLELARVEREALEERAKGRAADVRETGRALEEFPAGSIIPAQEARVRAAEAAGPGAIVMIGGDSTITAGEAALIAQIKKLKTEKGTA
jgi:hypothetical protein